MHPSYIVPPAPRHSWAHLGGFLVPDLGGSAQMHACGHRCPEAWLTFCSTPCFSLLVYLVCAKLRDNYSVVCVCLPGGVSSEYKYQYIVFAQYVRTAAAFVCVGVVSFSCLLSYCYNQQ